MDEIEYPVHELTRIPKPSIKLEPFGTPVISEIVFDVISVPSQ